MIRNILVRWLDGNLPITSLARQFIPTRKFSVGLWKACVGLRRWPSAGLKGSVRKEIYLRPQIIVVVAVSTQLNFLKIHAMYFSYLQGQSSIYGINWN